MGSLQNTAQVTGNYNGIPTSITSNTSVVNIIEGLTFTKDSDQTNWISGNLTYTITIDNQTDKSYVKPVVTDTIDTSLVDFVDGSVKIDGITATELEYEYNTSTHILTINLEDIPPLEDSTITFQVAKKS